MTFKRNSHTNFCFFRKSARIIRIETHTSDVHQIPDSGIGKGVPLQSLPDETKANRNRSRTLPHGETDQDLVPEQTHEAQEGIQ